MRTISTTHSWFASLLFITFFGVGCTAKLVTPPRGSTPDDTVVNIPEPDACADLALGDLDPDYGSDGFLTLDIDGVNNSNEFSATSLSAYADGSALVSVDGLGAYALPTLVRFDPYGDLDADFGTGGVAQIDLGIGATNGGIAVNATGEIFLGTRRNNFRTVSKVDSAGVLIPTFGTGGSTITPYTSISDNVYLRPSDGAPVLAGQFVAGTVFTTGWDLTATAFNATTGIEDNAFGLGGGGWARGLIAGDDFGAALAFDMSGSGFFLAGTHSAPFSGTLQKFGADGIKDATFSNAGERRLPGATANALRWIQVLSDGKILAAGQATSNNLVLLRMESDGSLDATFGVAGVRIIDHLGGVDVWRHFFVSPDERIFVVGGVTIAGGQERIAVGAFESDGTAVSDFGTNGVMVLDFGTGNQQGIAIAPTLSNQRILIYGSKNNGTDTDMLLARMCLK